MSSQTHHPLFSTTEKRAQQAAVLLARQERIPIWAFPRLFLGIVGLGFFLTFFDIGDINVSFLQTCSQIVPHCLPQTAGHYLGLPEMVNLAGYVVGALIFSMLADRFGRRDLLVLTMVIAGLGSFYTAFVNDYANFIIARALTGNPQLLMLDEPSLGLAPSVVTDIFSSIQQINAAGTTVLMVEQNVQQAFEIAHRGYVLENGRVTLEDAANRLLANPDVQRAYLGM